MSAAVVQDGEFIPLKAGIPVGRKKLTFSSCNLSKNLLKSRTVSVNLRSIFISNLLKTNRLPKAALLANIQKEGGMR